MTFAEVFSLPNGAIVDHYANFPNSVRKVALMDSKGEKLPVQRTSPA
jgi:hypothetical protein